MSKTKKIVFISLGVAALLGGTFIGMKYRNRDVATVQTGKVAKVDQLVQTVTATGEIKPLKYVNITATAFGRITEIPIKEGDRVKKGQLLMKQESVQPEAQLRSIQAALQQAQDNEAGFEAAYGSAQATLAAARAELNRVQAEFQRAQADFDRYAGLFKEGIVSKSQYDQYSANLEVARATVESTKARVVQAQADLNRADKVRVAAHSSVAQQRALTAQIKDTVDKTMYFAPLDAVVTSLPVRVGESAVVGIQNAQGSGLMILADLSIITAEVKVDETDITNLKLGQEAEVTVDAIPNKVFKGKVTEVGTSAMTRSGMVAGSSATVSQEAKEFKVVVTILDPTDELRPGLSTTAKITTATRTDVLAIPIQALTIREVDGTKAAGLSKSPASASATAQAAGLNSSAAPATAPGDKKKKKEEQGVFLVKNGIAKFVPVKCGITGQTDIEVLEGLTAGDEIITGSYKTLRTIQTDAKVKIDNSAEAKKENQKENK